MGRSGGIKPDKSNRFHVSAAIKDPLGKYCYNKCMFALIDKYGFRLVLIYKKKKGKSI